jgi:transposase
VLTQPVVFVLIPLGGQQWDAIRYLVRYGVEWRALPADFPPWQAVYAFFERWSARGLPQPVVDRLRGQLRVGAGRADLPTAAVIDSQSVKTADTVGAATCGYDGGNHAGRVVMPGSLRPVGVAAARLG